MAKKLLVSGASGHLGRQVLHHLIHTNGVQPSDIVATSRKPESLAAFAAQGVSVRAANFDDPASLEKAFAGADRMLLISTDTLDRPGARLAQHRAAVIAAQNAGVQHVVYTSMPNPDVSLVAFAPDHAGTEAALAASSIPGWTILRNHWYFENLYMSLPSVLAAGGQWFTAAGQGGLANISRDELAHAAAIVLSGSEQGQNVYTLSGREALTTAEQAEVISAAIGRPIKVVPVPAEGLVRGMVGAGLPEPVARVLASFDTNTAAGLVGTVTSDYLRITGRVPKTLAEWVQDHKESLVR